MEQPVDMRQILEAAVRWDTDHNVTEAWLTARSCAKVIYLAEHDFEELKARLRHKMPEHEDHLDDRAVSNIVALCELRVVECREHVRNALRMLAATQPHGDVAAAVLLGRLRLRSFMDSLHG